MTHKQLISHRTDGQPPYFTEENKRIDISSVIRQYQMDGTVTQDILTLHLDIIVQMEEEATDLTKRKSIHRTKKGILEDTYF